MHDLLKAQTRGLPAPLPIMRRETRDATITAGDRQRPLHEEATRAWNLHTAAGIYCPLPAFGPAAPAAANYPARLKLRPTSMAFPRDLAGRRRAEGVSWRPG